MLKVISRISVHLPNSRNLRPRLKDQYKPLEKTTWEHDSCSHFLVKLDLLAGTACLHAIA
jgi:hypothetical protein